MNMSACRFLILLSVLLFSYPSYAWIGSRQTHGTGWWGSASLTKFDRRIIVHPYFLDIEEDIELAPSGQMPPDNLNTLEISGDFSLPAQSVITGILIWDGDNLLQGKLKGKEDARAAYEDVVDRNTTPPPRPRDPILIEKLDSQIEWDSYNKTTMNIDRYNCSIYPVTWGSSRRIRIRYLCPQKYINNELVMQIPPSFSTEVYECLTNVSQKISSYGDIDRITIRSYLDTTDYSLPTTLDIKYDQIQLDNTYLKIPETENSMMVKTGFKDGDWKGNYAMYWGTPPDSLLIKAGLRREVVFLWKWNFWHTFVYDDNSTKTISPYGIEAINQARQIYLSNINITSAGDKVGLLLEKGTPESNRMFPLCRNNSKTFDSLQSFLASIDSSHLLSAISGVAPPIKIRVPEGERENFFSQSTQAFDVSLKVICSLFSEHEKVLKHIVLISAGPVPEMPNLEDYYHGSDDILEGKITISAYGSSPRYPSGYWPGIPMYRIVEKHALLSDGEYVNRLWIPEKKRARYSVTIRNSNHSYTMEPSNIIGGIIGWEKGNYIYQYDTLSVDTILFSGHSTSQWSDTLEWKAFNSQKKELATYKSVPTIQSIENDTLCVKLWAGTNSPVSDTSFTSNRGARYGVVDKQYSLLALEEDVVSQADKELLENRGLPFLKDDEIFVSEASQTSQTSIREKLQQVNISMLTYNQMGSGSFRVLFPGNETIKTLRIYDLGGRVVFQSDKHLTGTEKTFTFHNNGRLRNGLYTVVIETNLNRYVKRFQILQ